VLYRNAHGPFADVDQLDQVPHIGNMPAAELKEIKKHLAIRTLGENKPRVEP
jgi:DNA uptake protein ComE-like DNA-binding protein